MHGTAGCNLKMTALCIHLCLIDSEGYSDVKSPAGNRRAQTVLTGSWFRKLLGNFRHVLTQQPDGTVLPRQIGAS